MAGFVNSVFDGRRIIESGLNQANPAKKGILTCHQGTVVGCQFLCELSHQFVIQTVSAVL